MKDEELADKYAEKYFGKSVEMVDIQKIWMYKHGFLAGLKAGRPQWHKITDWKDNSQFPNDEFKTYLVRLYQDHYVVCELDITEGYSQFYLPDNLDDIDPEDVIAWCEIPQFHM